MNSTPQTEAPAQFSHALEALGTSVFVNFFVRIVFYYSCSLLKKKYKNNPGLFHSEDIIICKRLFPARGGAGSFSDLHFKSGVRLRGWSFFHIFLG